MASDVHVPYCEDETCLNHLRDLIKTLQKYGYTVSKNLIVGNYEQILKEKIENSCCTVLHKCETFWDKLHFFKLHEYILAQKAKFIVVRFESIYPAPKKQSNNDNAYEQFFKEFYVLPVTNEDNINDFLKGIQQSFPESMDVQETVTENTDIEARNITEIVSTDSDSSALYYASFFKRIEELRLKEKQQSSNKGQKLERFPEAHGNKLNDAWIFARVENQAQLSNHILDFSSLTNFKELKEKVNKIQRHPEKHIANLYFLLHIVLPDMHSSNDALGITYLAVSCPNIQRRAFLYLEDLIFKGRLAKNTDLDTLTVIQELFFNSITEIKQQRSINSVESSVEKHLNIIIEVQIEKIFLCHSSEDFDKLDLANKEMRKYLPKCKGWPNVDKLIKVLETILDSPGDKIQQEVRHILSKKQSDEYPYINVANFLGKKLSVIFAVVQSLLKKLFMNMNEKVLKFFKDCLHPKFGRKSLLLDSTC
ncbi:uncharacterized protein LOC131950307 [Physella acuta]|uniref:uncharacterized protein LOC131950307 n=1 Tax=Physella acuta TaxID=109671 RepID=UPI0027DD4128|nr:uncharacterized protein LOC131950307 [Physella acuta]